MIIYLAVDLRQHKVNTLKKGEGRSVLVSFAFLQKKHLLSYGSN